MKEQQNYELAFHLNPDLEEVQIQQLTQELHDKITSMGGIISFKKEPEKTRLSYPIKHKRQAYFGYIHFNIEDKEKLKDLDELLKLNNNILRYLLIKLSADLDNKGLTFKQQKSKPTNNKTPEKSPSEQSKDLDKELTQILENL
jgi:small subunit ribosomal protein S6